MSDNNKAVDFVNYDADDTKYGGAKSVVDAELNELLKRRNSDKDNLKGLALSGGGIRSASFCLGVIQALVKSDHLKKFDYLSTVSGGGYLGGSLSWLWLGKWRKNTDCTRDFGTIAANFPYGTGSRYSNSDQDMDKNQASLMRHLRQHGKYLTPGKGITSLSFLSVLLRSITMGLVTLLVLSSLFFHLLYYTPMFDKDNAFSINELDYGIYALVIYILSLLSYCLLAIRFKQCSKKAYLWRRRWEKGIKFILIAAIAIFTIVVVYKLKFYIDAQIESAGGISAALGALLAWFSQKSKSESILKIIPKTLLVNIGLVVMFLGLFVLSDQLAVSIKQGTYSLFGHVLGLTEHFIVTGVVLLLAYLTPINKVSIHRYYRDRLMETFAPDACKVLGGQDASVAEKVNDFSLSNCLPGEENDMPYHIINSNLILVESDIAKFKGRGGDNFILSPLYSGSNATGWRNSKKFAGDSITLPTAVAISGAAANSDSGVAGKGLTMNTLVSALMSIFNLRLGYWTVNPNPRYQSNQNANPNYLKPGFRGVINRDKLNEKADFIQLSDGGHFENLATYELIRRHCRLIVCCDAEQDNGFVFESLSNLIEKARVDFGVQIKISAEDLEKLRYNQNDNKIDFAEQGYLIADIIYPEMNLSVNWFI